MTKLSVNINKIATLRNARGRNNPCLLTMALYIEELGADGITVHPRPDERHIKKSDVFLLKKHLTKELNVEGFPSKDFIVLMQEICPAQITLVPDPPFVLTSNAGFKLREDFAFLAAAIKQLKKTGARISIFVDPKDFIDRDENIIKESGADRVELYTKSYADNENCEQTLSYFKDLARRVRNLGLGINAGHDLSLKNLLLFLKTVSKIEEVSIGHALICDALVLGLKETIKQYLSIVRNC